MLSAIKSRLEASSHFGDLQAAFLATGLSERRKSTSGIPVDNRLLLQVFLLKEDGNKPWRETEAFLQKVAGREDIPDSRMKTLTEKALREIEKLALDSEDFSLLLESFLNTEVDIDGLGPHLTTKGFTRSSLLQCDFSVTDAKPTNGVMIELCRFLKKNSLSNNYLLNWFCRMTQVKATLPEGTAAKLRKCVNKVISVYEKMLTRIKEQSCRTEALEDFKKMPFIIPDKLLCTDNTSSASSSTSSDCSVTEKKLTSKLGAMGNQQAALRRKLEDVKNAAASMKMQNDVLIADGIQKSAIIKKQAATIERTESRIKVLKSENSLIRKEKRQLQAQLTRLKRNNISCQQVHLKNKYSDQKLLHSKLGRDDQHHSRCNAHLKRTVRRFKTSAAETGNRARTALTALAKVRRENARLRHQLEEGRELHSKDSPHTGFLSQEAARHIFKAEVPDFDLPSDTRFL